MITRICKNPDCRKPFSFSEKKHGRKREFHSDKCRMDYYQNLRHEEMINDAKSILINSGYPVEIVNEMKKTTAVYIVKHDLGYSWQSGLSWIKE